MKTFRQCLWVALFAAGMAVGAQAQDPLEAAPDMYRLLFENDEVRVMEVTFQPGQAIAAHTHPHPHSVYVLEGGALRISKPDGSSMDATLEVGQVLWIPAERHWAENTGETVVRLLVTEIKSAGAHPHADEDEEVYDDEEHEDEGEGEDEGY
jgi:quercetin dioxygenase-like cupin family protein